MNTKTQLVAMALAITIAGSAYAGEEQEIALKDAPKNVQMAVKEFIGLLPEGAELEELEMETEGDSIVYEAEIEVPGGVVYEVEFSAQGKILEIEMEDDEEEGEEGDD